MTDLREHLMAMLDDEPGLPMIADRVVADGRRARRHQRRAIWLSSSVAGLAVIAVVAVPLADHQSGGSAQKVSIAGTGSPAPTATTSTAPGSFGFNPTGEPPACPTGQWVSLSSDLSTVVASGVWTAADHPSWIYSYTHSLGLMVSGDHLRVQNVATVNGQTVTPARTNGHLLDLAQQPSLWVLGYKGGRYTSSVLIVQTSASTWSAHPAAYAGCAPVPS